MPVRTFRPPHPVDLRLTLSPVRRGRIDPTMRIGLDGAWRATRTPQGPATTHITSDGTDITVEAWGPGAEWALDAAPQLVGATDSDEGFVPRHPVVADAHRRFGAVRLTRTLAVTEALVPTVCEQKVIGKQARRSYAGIVRRWSEPAPGPAGLLLPPDPKVLAGVPSYDFHALNIERKRADTIRLACRYAHRLDEATTLPVDEAYRRLTALPGVGPWSAAEVATVALGDPDAVSVGDYHLPNLVSWALAGEVRGDDDRMLELLEPYRGHRARVVRLLALAVGGAPRFGARLPLQHIADL